MKIYFNFHPGFRQSRLYCAGSNIDYGYRFFEIEIAIEIEIGF
jgi:hypothetical protein